MNYLADLEDKIVARLKAELPTVQRIVTVFNDDELLEAMKNPPSIAVRFLRADNDIENSPTEQARPALGSAKQMRRIFFSIFSIERNLRARNNREASSMYQNLAEIQDALMGWKPDLDEGCPLSGFVMGQQVLLGAINKTDVIYETQFSLLYRTKEPTK